MVSADKRNRNSQGKDPRTFETNSQGRDPTTPRKKQPGNGPEYPIAEESKCENRGGMHSKRGVYKEE